MRLLLVIVGLVAVATARPGTSCRQEVPSELIRDLWSRTALLIDKLPREEKSSRRHRLLPKFCTTGPQPVIGWQETRDMIDIYQRHVFSRGVVQRLLPLHYNDLLYRLQHALQRCVSSWKPSKWSQSLKKMERKLKRRKHKVALKAAGEFIYILRWIDELAQLHVL